MNFKTNDNKLVFLNGKADGYSIQRYDLRWGLFNLNLPKLNDPIEEVAVSVRWLYASRASLIFLRRFTQTSNPDAVLTAVFQGYSDDSVTCYGEMILELARTGKRRRGCGDQRYIYLWAAPPP
jgi:hypothetical protein